MFAPYMVEGQNFIADTRSETSPKINGITVVAPANPFENNPLTALEKLAAGWVAVIPYAYTRKNQPSVYYNVPRQWWGEKSEGITTIIRKAKEEGLSCMLKPQVYVPGGWVGDLSYTNNDDWEKWEKEYKAYIMLYVQIAIVEKVEIFCIGTEFKKAIQERTSFWIGLIKDIRKVYNGKLVYSSNWDAYQTVPFWKYLDYIGISAYFPLDEKVLPEKSDLLQKWKPIKKKMEKFSSSNNKPILFTEYGYLSVDGCAGKTWELEKKVHTLSINEEAQAVALDALYQSFWNEQFWAGGFLWKWFPDMQGHEGYPQKDYTPQNKIAETIIAKWYGKK